MDTRLSVNQIKSLTDEIQTLGYGLIVVDTCNALDFKTVTVTELQRVVRNVLGARGGLLDNQLFWIAERLCDYIQDDVHQSVDADIDVRQCLQRRMWERQIRLNAYVADYVGSIDAALRGYDSSYFGF